MNIYISEIEGERFPKNFQESIVLKKVYTDNKGKMNEKVNYKEFIKEIEYKSKQFIEEIKLINSVLLNNDQMKKIILKYQELKNYIENDKLLEQLGRKNYVFITEKGVLITTYSSEYYDETMKEVVSKLFGKQANMLKSRKELIELIEFGYDIKEIINLWDPLKIMDISFSNEYSYEINRIIKELLKNITIQNLRKEINKIFKSSYNGIYKIEKNEEIKIAQKIFEEYNNISKL